MLQLTLNDPMLENYLCTVDQEERSPPSRAREETKSEGTYASTDLINLVEKRYDSDIVHTHSSPFLDQASIPECFLGRGWGVVL